MPVRFYREHTPDEYLVIADWQHTLDLARPWLTPSKLPGFRRP
jgi:hypothetical protein